MKEKEIIEKIKAMDKEDIIEISTNKVIEFCWDNEGNDIHWEDVKIFEVSLTKEQIEYILKTDMSIDLTSWVGTVEAVHRYSTEKVEKCCKPAYGGFSNTNGISESGEIAVDKELLLS